MSSVAITSTSGGESLRIERRAYEDFVNYEMTASLAGDQVGNAAVVFLGTDDFIDALTAFERNREGVAMLDGTEDCWLSFESDGGTGDAWLNFQVARVLTTVSPRTGRGRSGYITLAGGFSVSGEFIGQAVREFKALFSGD